MICDNEKCTACYACYNVCVKNCISMVEDSKGRIYPSINESQCIKCNLCKKVCPSINEVEFNEPRAAYVSWAKDYKERESSTSGGLASIFANVIINKKGTVFGVELDNNIDIKHIRINKKEDVKRLKGSKYVHSKIENTFYSCKNDLDSGKRSLFIGTPCQIAGLKKYLMKEYSNLITVDLVCHGVPPQRYFKEYISNVINEPIVDKITFRDKEGYNLKVYKGNKVIYHAKGDQSLYYYSFLKSLFCRENCYSCKYAQRKRVSDITIGDFWGIGEEEPFNKSLEGGHSVVLTNTSKGVEFLEECKDELFIEKRNISEAIRKNYQLQSPSKKHNKYNEFLSLYEKSGFVYAANKTIGYEMKISNLKSNIKVTLKNNKVTKDIFNILKKIKNKNKNFK